MRQLLGRISTAFSILFGRTPTWWGIQAEWAEIQVGAADLFQKHNALAARLSKRIKELESLEDDCGCKDELPADAVPADHKMELRRRAFALRYGGSPMGPARPNGGAYEPPDGPRWVPADTPDPDSEESD